MPDQQKLKDATAVAKNIATTHRGLNTLVNGVRKELDSLVAKVDASALTSEEKIGPIRLVREAQALMSQAVVKVAGAHDAIYFGVGAEPPSEEPGKR